MLALTTNISFIVVDCENTCSLDKPHNNDIDNSFQILLNSLTMSFVCYYLREVYTFGLKH